VNGHPSVRGWLVPRLVFPLFERFTGRRFWRELRRLRKLQWESPAQLEARASDQLRPLLAHAYANVPYYRDLFDRAGLGPNDLRSLPDLARLPLSSKADLRAGFPDRVLAANLPARRRLPASTSGSTGLPFEFYLDRAGVDRWLASYLLFWEWSGVPAGSPIGQVVISLRLTSQAASSARLAGAIRSLLGIPLLALSGLHLTPDELQTEVTQLAAKTNYVIWGLPSYIARLGRDLLDRNIQLPRAPIAVISSGETLTAAEAATIRDGFRCRVVNHYSSFEVLHLAHTCPDVPDFMHVNSEHALVRIVREDGSVAAPGETGRVILTSLSNWVMPLINYDIGDWAVASESCPCGRGLPTLKSLEGRSVERIRAPSGKLITPTAVGWLLISVLKGLPHIAEYQAVQTAPDTLVLRIVPTSHWTADLAETFERGLEEHLGPGLRVTLETVDRIAPEPSGKRLVVKSELPTT
jgi:phenylacetate-CoA ligase